MWTMMNVSDIVKQEECPVGTILLQVSCCKLRQHWTFNLDFKSYNENQCSQCDFASSLLKTFPKITFRQKKITTNTIESCGMIWIRFWRLDGSIFILTSSPVYRMYSSEYTACILNISTKTNQYTDKYEKHTYAVHPNRSMVITISFYDLYKTRFIEPYLFIFHI